MANIDIEAPGDEQKALANALEALRPGLTAAKTIAAIGDSITADAKTTNATLRSFVPWGYLTWMRRFLGGRAVIDIDNIFAVGGNTVAQVRSEQLPSALAARTDICIVHCGINSLTGNAANTPTIVADYYAIMDALLANGTSVFMIPIMWKSATASPAFDANNQKQASAINVALLDYARTHKGVVVSDINPKMLDFSTGYAQNAFLRDGLHHNQAGAILCGKAHADRLAPLLIDTETLFAAAGDVYDATLNPAGNLLTNGLLTGTAGTEANGATGDTPTGWRGLRSAGGGTVTLAMSKEASAEYPTLENAVMSIGGTGDGVTCLLDQDVADANIWVGDTIYAECEVDYEFTTGAFRSIGLQVRLRNASNADIGVADDGIMNGTNGSIPEGSMGTMTLRTPTFTVPEGYSTRRVALQVLTPTSGSCAATIKVRRMSLRKVV